VKWRLGLLTAALAAAALVVTVSTSAKDFEPGDVRLCDPQRCLAVSERAVLRSLSSFIYGDRRPAQVRAPRLGDPVLQLRLRNGYVAGLVGSPRLDHFRSHGVICGRFRRGRWYRLGAALAHDLRRLAGTRLVPYALDGRVPRSC
jgi:hypothetical protein